MIPLRSKAQRLTGSVHSFVHIHIVDLLDGSPYHTLPSNTITWELPPRISFIINHGIAMTGSKIMAFIGSYLDEDEGDDRVVWRVVVWDWKTGDLVSLR